MKLWLYGLGMCQSMFCALPFPWHGWEEKARGKMLQCLPFIGLEIGLCWYAAVWLCGHFGLPGSLRGLVVCAVPYLLTGFMHLDGFMDVTDAVRSYRSLERRREILKDSHVGSFAVIGVALVLLAQYAAGVDLPHVWSSTLILIPVVSRCCSVLAIQILPPMTTSQYAAMEKKQILMPTLMLIAAFGGGFWMGIHSGVSLLVTAAGYGLALRRVYKSLQGMNGDISGYSLTLAELAGIIALNLGGNL